MLKVLKIVLEGEVIPSKKNSKNLIYSKRHNRAFILSSGKYLTWESIQVKKVAVWAQNMAKTHGIKFPLQRASCKIIFYWGNRRRLDNTNKAESIHDMLIKAKVITDDRWQVLNPTSQESKPCITTPRCEIYLSNFD